MKNKISFLFFRMPVVLTDGRSVGRLVGRSLGHVITKFSGMGRFIYPWCSVGALRARSSAMIRFHVKFGIIGLQQIYSKTNRVA